jgi:hypothetical protein
MQTKNQKRKNAIYLKEQNIKKLRKLLERLSDSENLPAEDLDKHKKNIQAKINIHERDIQSTKTKIGYDYE